MVFATRTKPNVEIPGKIDDSGRSGNGGPGDKGFGGGEPFEPLGWSVPPGAYLAGIWVGMASIAIFFAGISSALIMRKESSPGWGHFILPRILYGNTAVLLLSSLTFEISRKWLKEGLGRRFKFWLWSTLVLGLIFISGQIIAWTEVEARGVYLDLNPSRAVFYLLTAAHGLHLLAGIVALIYLVSQAQYIALGIKRHTAFDVAAIYWHFMSILWIYLLILLIWRF